MLIVLLAALALLFAFVAVGALIYAALLAQENADLLRLVRRARAHQQWAEEDARAILCEATQIEDALVCAQTRIRELQKQLRAAKNQRPRSSSIAPRLPSPFMIKTATDPNAASKNAHLN